LLVDRFLEQICQEYGIVKKKIDQDALDALGRYHWTGNIRELRNVVERLIILSGKQIILADVRAHVMPTA
jgi:DNA-binding NtrC family response regulator